MAAAAVLFSTFCPGKVEEERNGFPSHSKTENRAATEIRLGSCAVAMFGSESLLSCLCGSESRQGTVVLSAGEEESAFEAEGCFVLVGSN